MWRSDNRKKRLKVVGIGRCQKRQNVRIKKCHNRKVSE